MLQPVRHPAGARPETRARASRPCLWPQRCSARRCLFELACNAGANAPRSNQWSIRARMAAWSVAAAQAPRPGFLGKACRAASAPQGAHTSHCAGAEQLAGGFEGGLGGAGRSASTASSLCMASSPAGLEPRPSWHSSRRWGLSSSTVVSSRCTASFAMPSEMPRFSRRVGPAAASRTRCGKLLAQREDLIGPCMAATPASVSTSCGPRQKQQAHAQGFFQFAHLALMVCTAMSSRSCRPGQCRSFGHHPEVIQVAVIEALAHGEFRGFAKQGLWCQLVRKTELIVPR